MSKTVVGIFEYESDAQEAQNYLLANGFGDGDVDIKTASYKSETDTETDASSENKDDLDIIDRIGNFFKDLFDGDEDETKRYSDAGRRGSIVTVHTQTAMEAEAAADILDQFGAVDVNENAVSYDAGQSYSGSVADKPMGTYVDETAGTFGTDTYGNKPFDAADDRLPVSDEQSESLNVMEEDLQVGKREVETGGVRLRSRIFERPVQEIIRLREEQVNVNRTSVDRAASESDFDTFKEGTIEMKEYSEVPVVNKEARVVEEVTLNKTVDERDEVINETIRNTEVDVEDLTDEERLRRSRVDL